MRRFSARLNGTSANRLVMRALKDHVPATIQPDAPEAPGAQFLKLAARLQEAAGNLDQLCFG